MMNSASRIGTSIITASAALLASAGALRAQDDGWPREIERAEARIVVYQPQIETFAGDSITGRAAVSVTPAAKDEPVFGAVWFSAVLEVDRDNRTADIVNLSVPPVRFPNATEEQQRKLAEILESEVPAWDLPISLDRLLTSVELAERERADSEKLSIEPPKILVATQPSVLVLIEGEPVLQKVENTGLERVVNTPFTIIYDPDSGANYLYAGQDTWLTAEDLTGAWTISKQTPEKVAALMPPDTAAVTDEGASDADTAVDISELQVIVSTEPAELIVFDGAPQYTSIDGTNLLYVSNSESDVFLDIETQRFYVVLAGRWYSSDDMAGPWSYVPSDQLAADFAKIPPESARGSVLVYVAGTDEAEDAVLDASIPQT